MAKLLLIAADGLDWSGFDRQTRSGALPRLAALRNRGFAGSITGAPLGEGLAAFASIATGVAPEVHGVWRPMEAWAGGLRPTGRASWLAAPLWARLQAAGVATGTVGWPATRHGADWEGVHIDEDFGEPTAKTADDWALPPRCARADIREAIFPRRVHPTQITADMIRGFVPDLRSIDQTRPSALPALAIAMARAATHQAGAVWLLEEAAPDAAFVFHGLLGQVRAASDGRPEPAYAYAAMAAWRFLDSLIGRLVDVAGPEALTIVVSPGWRGRAGVVAAAGPSARVKPDFLGADILDVAPTVLASFGLEDRALPGRAFLRPTTPLAPAPSTSAPERVAPDEDLLRDAAEDGCPPPPQASAAWRAQGFAELAQIALRRSPSTSEALAARALALDPDNVLAMRVRAAALFGLERPEGLPELGRELDRRAPDRGWGALARGAYHVLSGEPPLAAPCLRKAEADPDVETRLIAASGFLMIGLAGDAERVFRSVLASDPRNAGAEIGVAMAAMARRDFLAAEDALTRAVAEDPGRAAIYETMERIYRETGRAAEAEHMKRLVRRLGGRALP